MLTSKKESEKSQSGVRPNLKIAENLVILVKEA